MRDVKANDDNAHSASHDFTKTMQQQNPSSHGEVEQQQGADFSELEKSRMDNPPENRDTNGSEETNSGADNNSIIQEDGIN